ncbi:DUF397 domain-containing protein [Streptosporangium sp. NPDC051023]|uniref:DUF397 domain-containing protein n=1 Tax=Streptosporangium sp. NPDC051023 TaxID=3155410 RepID=UPI00344BEB25
MQHPNPSNNRWRKNSLSADGPSCVEVAFIDDTVAVRDTKNRQGGTLRGATRIRWKRATPGRRG